MTQTKVYSLLKLYCVWQQWCRLSAMCSVVNNGCHYHRRQDRLRHRSELICICIYEKTEDSFDKYVEPMENPNDDNSETDIPDLEAATETSDSTPVIGNGGA